MAASGAASAGSPPKSSSTPPDEIVFGRSAAMQPIRQLVGKIINADLPVLIQGENGTGKGLLAQYIHERSRCTSGAFVKVNCAAIPTMLLESELFGHEKGAFTDAYTAKPGYVELAERGTLFLDEIADLGLGLQAKILQLLQDGQFSRIGDSQERKANTRVICATNRHLEEEIESGRFRRDLFYRINVITIHMPPLRERREDIALLAAYFLRHLNARFERATPPFPQEVLEMLTHREWRGNIRELENLVARYSIIGSLETVKTPNTGKHFAAPVTKRDDEPALSRKRIAKQTIRAMEGDMILKALRENKWNRRKAAEVLNISYRALIYKIHEAGLSQKSHRKGNLAESNPPGETNPSIE
jgi:two-component system, NtrC family, response regulator AtoC